jgi:ligand-binding sensor domain-containing protein
VNEDQYGTIWISTTDAGLLHLKDGRLTIYTVKDGLPSNRNMTAFGDRHGDLWLIQGKNLTRLKDGKLLSAPFTVQHCYEDREGTFWIGNSEGLAAAREMAVTMLANEIVRHDNPYVNGWVYCILADRAGTIWLGEWGGGVVRYRDGRSIHYVGGEEWKATLSNPQNHPDPKFVFEEGLFSGKVTSFYEDRAGVIWIGTIGGVSQFKDGQFKRYSGQPDLFAVWGIYQDRAGQMWFATSRGLIRCADGQFHLHYARRPGEQRPDRAF